MFITGLPDRSEISLKDTPNLSLFPQQMKKIEVAAEGKCPRYVSIFMKAVTWCCLENYDVWHVIEILSGAKVGKLVSLNFTIH